jgi:hypothetical protein
MSRTAPPPAPFSTWKRSLASLVAVLSLVLLGGGLMVPHGAFSEHSDLPVGSHLDANALHPRAPLHMETAHPEVVHACTACLLQSGRLSILSRPAAVPLPLLTRSLALPVIERLDTAPVRRLGPARAPPTASPFA